MLVDPSIKVAVTIIVIFAVSHISMDFPGAETWAVPNWRSATSLVCDRPMAPVQLFRLHLKPFAKTRHPYPGIDLDIYTSQGTAGVQNSGSVNVDIPGREIEVPTIRNIDINTRF